MHKQATMTTYNSPPHSLQHQNIIIYTQVMFPPRTRANPGDLCDDFYCDVDDTHTKGSCERCSYFQHPTPSSPHQGTQRPADGVELCICGAPRTEKRLCETCCRLVQVQSSNPTGRLISRDLKAVPGLPKVCGAGGAVKVWLDPLGLQDRRQQKRQQVVTSGDRLDPVAGDGVAAYNQLVTTRLEQEPSTGRDGCEGRGSTQRSVSHFQPGQMWELSWQQTPISDDWKDISPSQGSSSCA